MSAVRDPMLCDAVAALVEVTSCGGDPSLGAAAVVEIAEAIRAAATATIVLVWTQDPREATGCMVAMIGVSDDRVAGVADALAVHDRDGEHELGSPQAGALAAALASAGAPRGVVIPIAPTSRGLVVVAGVSPSLDDDLRRHAVRVGAQRIGTVLDALRMRDNLERAMGQILATDERMLGRMGLDIHDGPTQQLSVALLEVQLLEAELADEEDGAVLTPESLRPALARIYETVGGALHEMRELIGQLRPAQFEDRRLDEILQDAVTAFEVRAECETSTLWEGDFPINGVSITQRITLYRILQETLTNAQRHGRATQVSVRATQDPSGVTLEVTDNGAGFDPVAVQRRRPGMPLARFGLYGMRDRAQILGGSFDAASAPGEGTTIRVFLPRWDGPAAPEVGIDVA